MQSIVSFNLKNDIQVFLFKNEIIGQITDGRWENVNPADHYKIFERPDFEVKASDSVEGWEILSPEWRKENGPKAFYNFNNLFKVPEVKNALYYSALFFTFIKEKAFDGKKYWESLAADSSDLSTIWYIVRDCFSMEKALEANEDFFKEQYKERKESATGEESHWDKSAHLVEAFFSNYDADELYEDFVAASKKYSEKQLKTDLWFITDCNQTIQYRSEKGVKFIAGKALKEADVSDDQIKDAKIQAIRKSTELDQLELDNLDDDELDSLLVQTSSMTEKIKELEECMRLQDASDFDLQEAIRVNFKMKLEEAVQIVEDLKRM